MGGRPLLLLLAALMLSMTAPATCLTLTLAKVTTISNYITGFINSNATVGNNGQLRYPMLPTLVRLAFHDCAGTACDGCVNLNIASNKGLQGAVAGLESLYLNTTLGIKATGISRADFWALAGLVAANYGAKLQAPPPPPGPGGPPPPAPYIPASLQLTAFKTGRKDCATAPNGAETDAAFPDGLKTGADTTTYFSKNFGFNAQETVAILGAHTLGRATPSNSGFQGPWVPRDNSLDNAYYVDMSNAAAGWAQTKVTAPGGKIQWTRTGPPPPGSPAGTAGPKLLMLNADMGLLKAFTINSTGGASCTYATCAAAPTSTSAQVATYASNNKKWLDDFGAVFAKMQNICGRSTTTITTCTLAAPTAARAATASSVQAQIAAVTSSPQAVEAMQQAGANAAAAEAVNAAEPFIDPRPVVVASADEVSTPAEAAVAPAHGADIEGGRRRRVSKRLL